MRICVANKLQRPRNLKSLQQSRTTVPPMPRYLQAPEAQSFCHVDPQTVGDNYEKNISATNNVRSAVKSKKRAREPTTDKHSQRTCDGGVANNSIEVDIHYNMDIDI